jgi:hypothetical protein
MERMMMGAIVADRCPALASYLEALKSRRTSAALDLLCMHACRGAGIYTQELARVWW